MRVLIFWETAVPYVINSFHRSVSYDVAGDSWIGSKEIENFEGIFGALNQADYDTIIVAVSLNRYLERILHVIRNFKVTKPVYVAKQDTLEDRLPFIEIKNGEEILPLDRFYVLADSSVPFLGQVETHICDNCNLNCKACNNFSPFFQKQSQTYSLSLDRLYDKSDSSPLFVKNTGGGGDFRASVEVWANDIRRLASIYKIGQIRLLGGEPLLEPKLTKSFVTATRLIVPYTEIHLYTNATLIPSMKSDFWEVLKQTDTRLVLSVYPAMLKRISDVWKTLEKYNVDFIYHSAPYFARRLQMNENKKGAVANNLFGGSCGCHYLRDGYLYNCPDATLIKALDSKCGTHFETKCGISLNEVEQDPLAVLDKLDKPIDLCDFCNPVHQKLLPWERVEGEPNIKDWLIP